VTICDGLIFPGSTAMQFLCRLDDLPDGRSVGFNPVAEDYDTIFLIRRGGAVHGWQNACPHLNGARMNWKKDAFLNGDGSRIMCSAHGALFDIETGLCEIGPCVGKRLKPAGIELRDGDVFYVKAANGTQV
jgi:nitrite reductase/ring-hydroxylating ferredoxin subunit